ncbi:winged helix-turn-helix transcriptional regulator [Anaerofustis sp.]|nr:winged helix-turn-helix transcriptional regulator [Anaerofustis sp.]
MEYELSDLGYSIKPIIQSIYDWGTDYEEILNKSNIYNK